VSDPRVVFLVPWRGGAPDREKSWAIVRPYYEQTGWPMYLGDSGSKPFAVGQSCNRAAAAAGDWDVAIIINTDCIIPLENLQAGVWHALRTGNLTLPHDDFKAMQRNRFPVPPIDRSWRYYIIPWYSGGRKMPAGVVIMPRSVWDRIGGYDERFVQWGYEDSALLISAGAYDRLPGVMYHYFHTMRTDKAHQPSRELWHAEYWGRPQPIETLVRADEKG